jgi:hypothetical protein
MKITSKLVGASLALAGAMSLSAMNDSALAGSTTVPGEVIGYTWAPLPQGLYFATTEEYGNQRGAYHSDELASVPVLVWSTPWTLFNGRIESYVAVPSLAGTNVNPTGPGTTTHYSGFVAPFLAVGEAWDLGNGWGVSEFVGGYAPSNTSLGVDYFTFNERLGVTWAQGPWSLTGHVVYGVTSNEASTASAGYGHKVAPNYVTLDLTATYTVGKWSFGPVAYGEWDVSHIDYNGSVGSGGTYAKQNVFAVGGLVGYNFGPVILQTYVTRDVASNNYLNAYGQKVYATEGWVRAIVPLWTAPAPAPVVAKY